MAEQMHVLQEHECGQAVNQMLNNTGQVTQAVVEQACAMADNVNTNCGQGTYDQLQVWHTPSTMGALLA